MTDRSVSAAIVRYIEELEVALRHSTNVLDPALSREAGKIILCKKKEFSWSGDIGSDLDEAFWFAPPQWRIAGDDNDDFDLYVSFEGGKLHRR